MYIRFVGIDNSGKVIVESGAE